MPKGIDGLNEDSLDVPKPVEAVDEGTAENKGIADEEIEVLGPLLLDFPRDDPMDPSDTDGVFTEVRIEFERLFEDSLVSLLRSDLKLSGATLSLPREFAEKTGAED